MDKAERIQQQRERAVDQQAERGVASAASHALYDVVGVSFVPGYPDNVIMLGVLQEDAEASGEPLPVVLRRNPDNEYDSNAVEVHVPALGLSGMIGHLTRPIAARFAKDMDAGLEFAAVVASVRIHPDHQDRPGITIAAWRQETLFE